MSKRRGCAETPPGRTISPEGPGTLLWGIVAIDPQTERVWLRRLMIKPEP